VEAVTTDSHECHVAFVSLGSNLGDKMGNCRRGLEKLFESGYTELLEISGFYRTAPVDFEDQDWFVNAVVKVATRLDPFSLLKELLAIETTLGRRRQDAVRFGPRTLDMDLILYDAQRIESEALVVPHPRMHKRRFVLEPICDIEPELLHPVLKKTVRQLLADPDVGRQKLIPLGE
jgi:2-amino-4-hydroxy-6-hydroxymethyldihydropteridine diphosphokinase